MESQSSNIIGKNSTPSTNSVDEEARKQLQSSASPTFSAKYIILLLLCLVILFSGYLLYIFGNRATLLESQNMPTPSSNTPITPTVTPFTPQTFYSIPSQTPSITSDWKTYQNSNYAFHFLYPDSLIIENSTITEGFSLTTSDKNSSGFYLSISDQKAVDAVFSASILETMQQTWQDFRYEGIVVGGRNGRIISGYFFENGKKVHVRNIDIPLGNKNHIKISYMEDAVSIEEFNQMLATFQFTNR